MFQEFREFVQRGNVIDLAVAVIIGAAFNTIVNSLVNDIIMPPIGWLFGGVDFTNLYINLSGGTYESLAAAQEAGAATINYGLFINTVVNFLIVAFVIFLMIRKINAMKQEEEVVEVEEAAPEPSNEEKLLAEIRDLLKTRTG